MNKRLFFKICSVSIGSFLVIWSVAFTVFIIRSRNIEEPDISEYVAESAQNTVQSASLSHYIARTENGRVAVYEVYTNGFEKLIIVPEIQLNQLTEQDESDFSKGIILKDKAALASLLEDFTS